MRRAYKFRAYPTRPQQGRAVQLLADHCDLYNADLNGARNICARAGLGSGHAAAAA